MFRRLLALLFAVLTVQSYSLCNVALAKGGDDAASTSADGDITVYARGETPVYFASGAKYDQQTHQWKDRYNGKSIDLGIPGVAGRYGVQNVVADNTVIAAGPTSGATTPSTGNFSYQKFLLFTLLGLGIATSIAVPVALGAHHYHNHHHQQNVWNQNQAASYFFFHNQTLPIPKLILPPPPPVEHGSGPPPKNP